MLDLLLKNVRLPGSGARVDIGIRDGVIAALGPAIAADAPAEDMGGALVLPGLVETHIHLDKSCILDRCSNHDGTLASAIDAVSKAKRRFTPEDVYERGRKTLEKSILQGTNLMRTHVEVDPGIGLAGFEALLQLKHDYAWAIDLQICVFPQEGLTNYPGTAELLAAALVAGADLLGGCPYTDSDPAAQIAWTFETARDFDVDLDFHLDFDLDPSWMHLDEVIRQTVAHGYQGRVTVGHATKLSMLGGEAFEATATRLADAGVAVTVLPATDLFLTGRDMGPARPRGVTAAHALAARGVRCSLATNNVLNPFTPFGDCSLTRIANLYANIHQIGDIGGMEICLDLVSGEAARLMRKPFPVIAEGSPATFILVDAESPAMSVAEIAHPFAGYRKGRRTFEWTKPRLLRP